jgi:macrolide transport system ATP-binding/permease protein
LLAVQAALLIVLVAGATMLARSLDKLEHQDFGFKVDGRVLTLLEDSAGHLHDSEVECALPPD